MKLEAILSKRSTGNTNFTATPTAAEIELATKILMSRKAAKRRQRISKYRTHIPTIFALLEAGKSLRVACELLHEIHGFEGSAAGLCRFLQSYPLLREASRQRGFDTAI